MGSEKSKTERTCRELGGDIFAAFARLQGDPEYAALEKVNFAEQKIMVDVVMRVLATHVGTIITQDDELPVKPLGAELLEARNS